MQLVHVYGNGYFVFDRSAVGEMTTQSVFYLTKVLAKLKQGKSFFWYTLLPSIIGFLLSQYC